MAGDDEDYVYDEDSGEWLPASELAAKRAAADQVEVRDAVGNLLADSHPSKKLAMDFVAKYDKAYGAGTHNQFAGHAYDAQIVLEKIVPMALKKAKPGTKEFRAALKEAMETMGRTVFSHGVMNWTPTDHNGYTMETGVMLKVVNGAFVVEK